MTHLPGVLYWQRKKDLSKNIGYFAIVCVAILSIWFAQKKKKGSCNEIAGWVECTKDFGVNGNCDDFDD